MARPPSSARPPTSASRRPTTGDSFRPDTGVSTISSLEPAPNTFQPDIDEDEDEDEDDEPDSEPEQGVFAFHRPQTGAVPQFGQGSPLSSFGGEGFSDAPGTGDRTHRSSTTPGQYSFTTNSIDQHSTNVSLPSFAYSADTSSLPVSVSHPTGEYSSKGHLVGARTSTATTQDSDDFSFSTTDENGKQAIRMRSFTPLVGGGFPSEEDIDSKWDADSRAEHESRGTWITSEMDGVTTIPDGQTTRGGGELDYEKGDIIADMHEDDSPYDEVRVSVSNLDDPDMPTLTFRVWLIGMVLGSLISATNTFLYFRSSAPSIPSILVLLIAFPIGKIAAWVLPITEWTVPSRVPYIGGSTFTLNPGPFNMKEHAMIVMMSDLSNTQAYALGAITAGQVFYKFTFSVGFEILFVISTHITGLCLAGVTRRFLVEPASLIWPQVLITCTVLNTLHAEEEETDGRMPRLRFFFICFGAGFAYYFLPGFLFTALGFFSWICWIKPNNIVVNQLFGTATGLGMSILTFDWSQINWLGSPLVTPWWAEVNMAVGFVVSMWIVVPAMYYSNVWSFKYLPVQSSSAFDRFGEPYNYTRILTENRDFDAVAYAEYSPLYLTSVAAMGYMASMMLLTAAIVHTLLFNGRGIYQALRGNQLEKDDVHAKLMRAYKQLSYWWYGGAFVVFFVFGVCAVQIYSSGVPVWALIVALLLPAVYALPAGYVLALTGQTAAPINVLVQIISGYLFPGRPVPGMVFKSFSVEVLFMAGIFSSSMKLGHYIKVPPRNVFTIQLVMVLTSCLIQVGVKQWLFATTPDICTEQSGNSLTCPRAKVFFTASVLWGLIGPERQFGPASLYHPALYAMLLGAVLPLLVWLWARKFPKSWARNVNLLVLLNAPLSVPVATGVNYTSFVLTGFVFQYVIRRRNFAWWSKYNYVLSAALDTGTILGIIVVFLALQLPKDGTLAVTWWGTTVHTNTLDWENVALRIVPETGFGPDTWPV